MTDVEAFAFHLHTRLVVRNGAVSQLGDLARELGAERVFVVTDRGLAHHGHVARMETVLVQAGLEVITFADVPENPDADDVADCRAALGDWPADLLIGFGGGSSIDVAKGTNFLRAGGGTMQDYWGRDKGKGEFLPLIAVPTTAGTGTEVQSFALIEQPGTHQKMACGDRRIAPAIALLDPELSLTMPHRVTAATGMDAIGHAVETAVTRKRNAGSAFYATEAFRLAHIHLPRVLENPGELVSRAHMLKASTYAGIAIEQSMLGAAHSLANPLTAHHHVTHGQAVGLALPHVVRFNAEDPATRTLYANLARDTSVCPADTDEAAAVEALITRLNDLLADCGFDGPWTQQGVVNPNVPALAEEAARQWTAQFNPRDVGADEFAAILSGALGGAKSPT